MDSTQVLSEYIMQIARQSDVLQSNSKFDHRVALNQFQNVQYKHRDGLSINYPSIRIYSFTKKPFLLLSFAKGQINSKIFFKADVSSKKRTNKFDFTPFRLVFVRFLEESEDTEKTFRNELTFR